VDSQNESGSVGNRRWTCGQWRVLTSELNDLSRRTSSNCSTADRVLSNFTDKIIELGHIFFKVHPLYKFLVVEVKTMKLIQMVRCWYVVPLR
jgi:hypothetical protein